MLGPRVRLLVRGQALALLVLAGYLLVRVVSGRGVHSRGLLAGNAGLVVLSAVVLAVLAGARRGGGLLTLLELLIAVSAVPLLQAHRYGYAAAVGLPAAAALVGVLRARAAAYAAADDDEGGRADGRDDGRAGGRGGART